MGLFFSVLRKESWVKHKTVNDLIGASRRPSEEGTNFVFQREDEKQAEVQTAGNTATLR
jgi:hypothetical protein